MAGTYYMGQVMMTGFGFAPKNFVQCNGDLLSIAQNQALFSLLGVNFGGDGRSTFGIPDMRSRTPVGQGSGYALANAGGAESVVLSGSHLPAHNHTVFATTATAAGRTAQSGYFAASLKSNEPIYGPMTTPTPLSGIGNAGGGQAHTNIQPFQAINFCICLAGAFPSRT